MSFNGQNINKYALRDKWRKDINDGVAKLRKYVQGKLAEHEDD